MSASASRCQFFPQAVGCGGDKLQPQLALEDKEIDTFSDIECPPFKRVKTSATLPTPVVPVALSKATPCYFKTQLCVKFRLGKCTLGARCRYAHGVKEINSRVIHGLGLVNRENRFGGTSSGEYKMHYERQLCRMFSGGKTCPYEDRCRFLHLRPKNTRQYVGEFRDNSVIPISNSRNSGHGRRESGIMSFDAQVNLKQVLFKTKLCNNWEMVGDCSYGKRCRFAHGQAEMQNLGDYTASEYGIMQATSKTLTTVQKSSAGRMTTDLSPQEQLHEVKFQFKLNELEKISRIYADWVEDMPLLPSSLSKAK